MFACCFPRCKGILIIPKHRNLMKLLSLLKFNESIDTEKLFYRLFKSQSIRLASFFNVSIIDKSNTDCQN